MKIIGYKKAYVPQLIFHGTCDTCGAIVLAENDEVKEVKEDYYEAKCPKCKNNMIFEVHILRTLYRRFFC